MATPDDQLRRARDRDFGVRGEYDRLPPPPPAAQAFRPCITVDPNGAYPDAPNVYYYVSTFRLTGPVGEGLPVDKVVDGVPFLAAHLGNAKVPVGTEVMVFQAGRCCFPYYA